LELDERTEKKLLTKEEAVNISIQKWEKCISWYKANRQYKGWQEGLMSLMQDDCGFCIFYGDTEEEGKEIEVKCPLFPSICTASRRLGPSLYWKIYDQARNGHKRGLLPMLKYMLQEIRAKGQQWTKQKEQLNEN